MASHSRDLLTPHRVHDFLKVASAVAVTVRFRRDILFGLRMHLTNRLDLAMAVLHDAMASRNITASNPHHLFLELSADGLESIE